MIIPLAKRRQGGGRLHRFTLPLLRIVTAACSLRCGVQFTASHSRSIRAGRPRAENCQKAVRGNQRSAPGPGAMARAADRTRI
ncbi:hypothetical protein OE88DRAFT_1668504 [Heliocybe sulcata]|uniref:Uncharacterized protein n=1 Tax=Heliocybe sulcata TaxID=5364 RepID=A0A5C3MMI2_9AGAM|nr:hypothetical protein OE88DRAFT_1668504 [Heliocybe sulcata]